MKRKRLSINRIGGVMKKLVIAILCFLVIFYTIRSITCPTCIGLPKAGQRPFFEHNKITYAKNMGSCPIGNDEDELNKGDIYNPLEDEEC